MNRGVLNDAVMIHRFRINPHRSSAENSDILARAIRRVSLIILVSLIIISMIGERGLVLKKQII